MIIPVFEGGLGNIMFQLGSCYSIAKKTGHRFGINSMPIPPCHHSSKTNYMDTIFAPWNKYMICDDIHTTFQIDEINGYPLTKEQYKSIISHNENIISLHGYFQNESYLRPYRDEIINMFSLTLDEHVQRKYDDIDNSYFLHVRRGDYVGNKFHEMDLTDYYREGIDRIGNGHVCYVASNDIGWCEDCTFLQDISCKYIKENEVDTLAIMSRCKLGGISANSSFSWWGLYLDINRPYLIMPSRWFPHDILYQRGYIFKEAYTL